MLRYVTFSLLLTAWASARDNVPFDTAAVNNPGQPDLHNDDRGPGVVRAQILLARAHFSCGEIDGNFGTNLQKTLTAYQDNRKIPVSGSVDAATWAVLNADTAPVLMTYTIAPD